MEFFNFVPSKKSKSGGVIYSVFHRGQAVDTSLKDFDGIKSEDLEVGTSVGAEPTVPRTFVDPDTHTYVHGEEGVLMSLKRRV